MKTKALYVLTSNEQDSYYEQTLISVVSLRRFNPDMESVLLVDDETDKTLTGKRAEIINYVSQKIVVPLDAKFTKKQRSRILKTTMRSHIAGDFLYIDADTVVIASLAEADSFDFDIGAVLDNHTQLQNWAPHAYKIYVGQYLKKMKWEELYDAANYFNSGVLFVRDCENTQRFFADWHRFWTDCANAGLYVDQPSFAKANLLHNSIITEMPGVWNCQIVRGVKYFAAAKILHYNSAFGTFGIFDIESVFQKIKNATDIENIVSDLCEHPFDYFNDYVEITGKKKLDLYNSLFVRLLYKLYKKHSAMYLKINSLFEK